MITTAEAVHRYPELQDLAAAREAGWSFRPIRSESGCVWSKEGSDLQEVVRELFGLPEPGQRGAPHLVKLSSLLWTPL